MYLLVYIHIMIIFGCNKHSCLFQHTINKNEAENIFISWHSLNIICVCMRINFTPLLRYHCSVCTQIRSISFFFCFLNLINESFPLLLFKWVDSIDNYCTLACVVIINASNVTQVPFYYLFQIFYYLTSLINFIEPNASDWNAYKLYQENKKLEQ